MPLESIPNPLPDSLPDPLPDPLLRAIAAMPLPLDAQRVFHGRGGAFPGCEHWVLDAFPPVFVLTSFQPVPDAEVEAVGAALAQRWQELAPGQPLNWVFQTRIEGRSDTRLMAGAVPEPHDVSEAGARFRVHVLKGQNHGLFLDMAEGRRWVREHLAAHAAQVPEQRRMKVLNLFAYTCAFSVVALQAGARQVVNLDMSHGALGIGKQNHSLNGLAGGASFLPHDLFTSWGKVNRGGPYGLVIADPPSYQKGSFVATKDYARLVRRLPDLLVPGGHALLCLNAPELDTVFLHGLVQEHAPALRFVQRLTNPATFPDAEPERALKVLLFQLPELAEAQSTHSERTVIAH